MIERLRNISVTAALAAAVLIFITFSPAFAGGSAQETPPVIIRVAEADTGRTTVVADPGDQVTMRITGINLEPVAGLSFALTWDPEVVTVTDEQSVTFGNAMPFGFQRLDAGSLSLIFAGTSALNLQSAIVVEVRMTVTGPLGSSTALVLGNVIAGDAGAPGVNPAAIENVVLQGATIQVGPILEQPSPTPVNTSSLSPTPTLVATVPPAATLVPTVAPTPLQIATQPPAQTPFATFTPVPILPSPTPAAGSPDPQSPTPTSPDSSTPTATPTAAQQPSATPTPHSPSVGQSPNTSTPAPLPSPTRTPIVTVPARAPARPTATPQPPKPTGRATATFTPTVVPSPTQLVSSGAATATPTFLPTPQRTLAPSTPIPVPTAAPNTPTATAIPTPTVSRLLAAVSTPMTTPGVTPDAPVAQPTSTPTPSGGSCSSSGGAMDGMWLVVGLFLPSWSLRRRMRGLIGKLPARR